MAGYCCRGSYNDSSRLTKGVWVALDGISTQASFFTGYFVSLAGFAKILSILDMGFHLLMIEESFLFDYLSFRSMYLFFYFIDMCFLKGTGSRE